MYCAVKLEADYPFSRLIMLLNFSMHESVVFLSVPLPNKILAHRGEAYHLINALRCGDSGNGDGCPFLRRTFFCMFFFYYFNFS